ncbi:MAG: efflux RND transporter permease subunit [Myxococcota bacterium]|nr:efflux RND transporter permease subunit [Myxococcota bacterium]
MSGEGAGAANVFYRNPRLTALAIGLITVAGFAALQALARQEDPTLARRFGTVTTFYPGASALRVESLVTEKLESRIQELYEVAEIDSVSRSGVSMISIELDDRYEEADVDEIWSKVRDKLADAEAELPAGAGRPEFEDRTSTAVTVLAALTWAQPGAPQLGLLSRLAEELENRLRNLPYTKETDRFGEAEEEVRVTIDPLALAAVNLTAADVSYAIARADAKRPAGQLRHGANDLLIEVEGEIDSVARVRAVPVRQESDGRLLRVGDIARVEKTVVDPPATQALVHGVPGVVVSATMESGHRVDRWAARARAELEAFRAELPPGVGFELIFDQSGYTEERLGTLVGNLVMGATIVVAVLFFLLGARSALIVASALPLTVAMVLAQLNLFGVPLHQTSITGLIIALGLLIDNAIVVVDEFNRRVARGSSVAEAVAHTVRLLVVPLAASTLTTVLAFLPIVLMPGGAGEFVGPISIGVILSITSSFLLSMTVIPALAGFATRRSGSHGGHWWSVGFSSPRLTDGFRRLLGVVLRRPALGVGLALVLPITGFVAGSTLGEQFFPANDRNQFQVQLVLPSQTSIAETRANALRARALVHAHPDVLESHWFLGESAPRVFYNMFANEDGVSSHASAFVTTRSPDATERLLPALQRQLIEAFPNARVIALPFEQGPPFEAPIEVRVIGPDVETLRALGEQVRGVLAETADVTYTSAKLAGGEPKLLLAADEDEARLAGLTLGDVADQLQARLEGAVGGSLLEANEEIPVRVRVGAGSRDSLAGIVAGRLLPRGGVASPRDDDVPGVPLSVVSEVALVPELGGVTRRQGERSNTIQAFLTPYALIADSLADFERRLEVSGFALPPGYRIELGGESEQRGEALSKLAAFALPLFVLMAGAIILTFNSFRLAGIIFGVAFLGVGLAMFGVWLGGHPMGFVAIVGTMGLVGLAINDSIVVLTALRSDARALAADPDGTAEVVIGATRHVLGTTFTTIGGFLPLILFGGRFWPPMACAIAGGVVGSSILALILVPSLFIAIRRRIVRRAPEHAVPLAAVRPSPLRALPELARDASQQAG